MGHRATAGQRPLRPNRDDGTGESGESGYATDLDTLYRDEREQELRGLCDVSVREAIRKARIQLCSLECFREDRRS